MTPVHNRIITIIQERPIRIRNNRLAQRVVELEDLCAEEELWILAGVLGTEGDVARGEVCGDRAGVEFVLEAGLDGVAGEGDGAEGAVFGVDGGYACDEEVGPREVETGRG